jgi:DNA-binding transcriptional ArsR family regulator
VQLADELPVSRPAVSQHLRVLKEAGLVTDHADGTRRIYRLNQQGVRAIHSYLDQMWSQAMTGFRAAAQRIAEAERDAAGPDTAEPDTAGPDTAKP